MDSYAANHQLCGMPATLQTRKLGISSANPRCTYNKCGQFCHLLTAKKIKLECSSFPFQTIDPAPCSVCRQKSLRFASIADVWQLAARHAKKSGSGKGAEVSAMSDAQLQQPSTRAASQLWKAPRAVMRTVTLFRTARAAKHSCPRRSSLKSPSTYKWKRLQHRHVRFQGMPSALTVWIITVLVRFVCPGSSSAAYWSFLIACANAADSLLLPLALVAREFLLNEEKWLRDFDEDSVRHAVGKHRIWTTTELWLDVVFIVDFLFRAAQAAVLDMGFAESTMERIVHASRAGARHSVEGSARSSEVQNLYERGWVMGEALQRQLFVGIPLRIVLMLPMWIDHFLHMGSTFVMVATLARVYRLVDLMRYFSACQEDVAKDVRLVAFFKFAFIMFSTVGSDSC